MLCLRYTRAYARHPSSYGFLSYLSTLSGLSPAHPPYAYLATQQKQDGPSQQPPLPMALSQLLELHTAHTHQCIQPQVCTAPMLPPSMPLHQYSLTVPAFDLMSGCGGLPVPGLPSNVLCRILMCADVRHLPFSASHLFSSLQPYIFCPFWIRRLQPLAP